MLESDLLDMGVPRALHSTSSILNRAVRYLREQDGLEKEKKLAERIDRGVCQVVPAKR